MCVEIPSRVVLVKDNQAKIKQGEHSCWIDISAIDEEVKEGDYLITYQNIAVNKVPQKEIDELLALIGNLPEHHH